MQMIVKIYINKISQKCPTVIYLTFIYMSIVQIIQFDPMLFFLISQASAHLFRHLPLQEPEGVRGQVQCHRHT